MGAFGCLSWSLNLPVGIPAAHLSVAVITAAWISVCDLKFLRIPNFAVIVLVICYFLLAPFTLPLSTVVRSCLIAASALLLGFALFLAGGIGAGDVKLIAASFLYVQPYHLPFVFVLFSIVTVFAASSLALLRLSRRRWAVFPDWASLAGKGFPLGWPLSMTLVIYLLWAPIAGL